MYDLVVKTYTIKQRYNTITEYSNLLKHLWQEHDQYHSITMENSKKRSSLEEIS